MLIAINPHTGKTVREFSPLSNQEMEQRITAAARAFPAWRDRDYSQRAEVLRRVAGQMRSTIDTLASYMTEEMGKPIKEAYGEIEKSAWCAEHYAEHAPAYLAAEQIASDAKESRVEYRPLGPILGILPWNAPFWLAFRFLAPTLMAGNTCIMKHDPHVPGCAAAIANLFSDAPEGIVVNLPVDNTQAASAITHPAVHGVSFTGSSAAGSRVAAAAASQLKPSVLELGGSDPAIVLADADLERAAAAISLSRIINAGQSCIAAKRIIVENPVYDHFVQLLHARLSSLQTGDPHHRSTDIGPLARADLRENLHRQVTDSIAEGARCLLGGSIPAGPGFHYPATLLTEATNDMTVCKEETFGPVAVVLRADSPEQAIRIANDTEYGLAASLWTTSSAGPELVRRLEAGQVVLNGIVKTDPRLPSGGIRKSGLGRELGPHGIREFVNTCQVWLSD
ncbi:NAD-dependent succinate-semialdehyde dehydrogenase [Spirochaeta africana]|uniref:NAD-dependent aldehyde dehydrogenase n=1 Tax=Spirochaeta africana (strain ATCC 700263 / DSM 8902 / Z-7692) TaxID=889378 RepID=H9UFJ3_SPIAZ|nr:NAD-dependent succinate-semialdehyde dehydrogenase [Spirochaeta africana]AFG36286.1 NAD-dependent aldehyde dehydrogenase [Spirochaeta africana DSM 8902]